MSRKIIENRKLRRVRNFAVVSAVAGAALGGCGVPPEMGQTPRGPAFYISDELVVSRDVAFSSGSTALSPVAESQLDSFISQVDPDARDRVTVIGYGPLGLSRANGVAHFLRHAGIRHVEVARVDEPANEVTVSVASTVQLPTSCLNPSNIRPIDGFPYLPPAGCANDYNLAGMIADPADLDRGRSLGPAEGGVYADAVQRYRQGAIIEYDAEGTAE